MRHFIFSKWFLYLIAIIRAFTWKTDQWPQLVSFLFQTWLWAVLPMSLLSYDHACLYEAYNFPPPCVTQYLVVWFLRKPWAAQFFLIDRIFQGTNFGWNYVKVFSFHCDIVLERCVRIFVKWHNNFVDSRLPHTHLSFAAIHDEKGL